MRISDWSSEVCSSDLIAPGAVIPANAVLPFTPKWSLSGGLAYEFEISTAGTMTLRGDWNYRTATYLSADNNTILRQPAYHMVNLSASFLTAGQGVRVTGGVTNLTNKAILMSGFADLQGSSIADRSAEHTSELQSPMR